MQMQMRMQVQTLALNIFEILIRNTNYQRQRIRYSDDAT